jgi:hypothetical protein
MSIEDFPNFELRIATAVEYCLACQAIVTQQGCSNPDCYKSRPLYPLQEALRKRAIEKHYGNCCYKAGKEQVFHTM